MATLVAPLASGVAGAESGTAYFYARGTEDTALTVYSDVDATVAIGTSVDLDANGGAEVYVTESARVVAFSSAGTEIRTFTVAVQDATVDVASRSFTGLLSSGSQGAGGAVDLATVLDRWYSSAGTLDFKVLRSGQTTAETLITAFSNVAATNKPFFNVKDYSATGNGSTDDYAAIVATYNAAVAAGGGIMFFPAGQYMYSAALSFTSQKVAIMGAGAASTILTPTFAAGQALTINAGVSTFSGITIQDISIRANTTGANITPILITSTPGVILKNVLTKDFALTADFRSKVILMGCDFTVPTSATAGDYVAKFSSSASDSLILGGSFTQSRAANTGGIYFSNTGCMAIDAAVDTSAVTSGIGINVDAANCRVLGCKLTTGGSTTFAIQVTDVAFTEAMNQLAGSGRLLSLTTAFNVATATPQRLTRLGKINVISTSTAGAVTPDADYEIQRITFTNNNGAGSCNIATPTGANSVGSRLVITIINSTGSAITGMTWGSVYDVQSTAWSSLANGSRRCVEFVATEAGVYTQVASFLDL